MEFNLQPGSLMVSDIPVGVLPHLVEACKKFSDANVVEHREARLVVIYRPYALVDVELYLQGWNDCLKVRAIDMDPAKKALYEQVQADLERTPGGLTQVEPPPGIRLGRWHLEAVIIVPGRRDPILEPDMPGTDPDGTANDVESHTKADIQLWQAQLDADRAASGLTDEELAEAAGPFPIADIAPEDILKERIEHAGEELFELDLRAAVKEDAEIRAAEEAPIAVEDDGEYEDRGGEGQ